MTIGPICCVRFCSQPISTRVASSDGTLIDFCGMHAGQELARLAGWLAWLQANPAKAWGPLLDQALKGEPVPPPVA